MLHAPFSELFPCAIDPKIRTVAAERYRQVIRICQGYVKEVPDGIVICLENVLEEDPSMLSDIIRQVSDSIIRMYLDVGHVNAYSPVPVMQRLEQCADLIAHFHIHNNDTSQDSHSQLWEGTIPMAELLSKSVTLQQSINLTRRKTGASVLCRHFVCTIAVSCTNVLENLGKLDVSGQRQLPQLLLLGIPSAARGHNPVVLYLRRPRI